MKKIRSFSMVCMKESLVESKSKDMPERWFKGITTLKEKWENDKAIGDALDEGKIFIRMLKENQGRK